MADLRLVVFVPLVLVSAIACTAASGGAAHPSPRPWSAVGVSGNGQDARSSDVAVKVATPNEIDAQRPDSPRRDRPSRSADPPQSRRIVPSTVDESSADAVAVAGAKAMASVDTALDVDPNHAAVRAAREGWLTPRFAQRVESATIVGSAGELWTEWTRHRVYVVVTARLSGDDHPPDTATTAARMVLLTLRPIGRDGWQDHRSTTVVTVVLKKIHKVWRIDSDQRT